MARDHEYSTSLSSTASSSSLVTWPNGRTASSSSPVTWPNSRTASSSSTPCQRSSDTLSSLRNKMTKKCWSSDTSFSLKSLPADEQHELRAVINQAILALFYAHPGGMPPRPELWSSLIKDLYQRLTDKPMENITRQMEKAVCPLKK